MAYPDIATINISLDTLAASAATFGTPTFLAAHKAFIEVVRSYGSLEEVVEDFDENSSVYRAARSFFSPTPKPQEFKVGRVKADALFSIGDVAENVDFSIGLGVNENATAPVTYTAQAGDDAEAVVDALIIAIDALYSSELTTTKIGSGNTAQLSISPVSGNDFVLGTMLNVTVALTATETAVEAKNNVAAVDPEFFWVTSEFKDQTNVLALAADTEAEERIYAVSLADTDSLEALLDPTTDTSGLLKDAGYQRTFGVFHQDADDFPELAIIARFTYDEPGTIDWYAKTIPGFGVSRNPDTGSALTTTELTALSDRNVNYIVSEGGLAIFKKGITFSGNTLMEVVFRDFYAARLREGFQTWRINKKRIPYTQRGIDSAENVFRSITERYVSTEDRPHAIEDYVPKFPTIDEVSFSDKSAGILTASADIYMAGAIFSVVMNGTLTYNNSF